MSLRGACAVAISCRNHRPRTTSPTMSLRGAQRRGNLVQELPSAYKPTTRDCHDQCAHWSRNDKKDSLLCHCEERSDAAISCRNYQVRTNLQPEIATTSVRTGLAMTKSASYYVIARSAATRQSCAGTAECVQTCLFRIVCRLCNTYSLFTVHCIQQPPTGKTRSGVAVCVDQ